MRELQVASKRGSYLAEAAVVMPLVILAVITVVLILMFFYEESACQSRLHMELRQKAAVETGHTPDETTDETDATGTDGAGSASIVLEVSRDGMFQTISGYSNVRMVSRGLLSSLRKSEVKGSWHGADGVAFKRLFD